MTARKTPKEPAAPLPRLAWTPREVSEQIGIPYESVLDAIHAGTIPGLKIGRHYLVTDADLKELLQNTGAQ